MAKVFLSKEISKIINSLDFSRLGDNVGIKVHFGERGCTTYMRPEIVKAVYDKIVSLDKKAALIECNVLYRGSRTNTTSHKKTALDHGFGFAPVDILDGEHGNKYIEIPVKNGVIDNAKVGKDIKKYDSLVVISHFKGHISAGYGGVFKQIGMGLGSRAGKLHMHAGISPNVNQDGCIGCGKCVEGCDFDAIELINNKARIDNEKCIGCAMCIAVCPTGVVSVPWGANSSEELQKRIVDYTTAVFSKIPKERCIFVNILENITEECDCMGIVQTPLMDDIGILASYDPVAVDKASLELVEKYSPGVLDKFNRVDKNVQCDYAASRGLGELDYEIENV